MAKKEEIVQKVFGDNSDTRGFITFLERMIKTFEITVKKLGGILEKKFNAKENFEKGKKAAKFTGNVLKILAKDTASFGKSKIEKTKAGSKLLGYFKGKTPDTTAPPQEEKKKGLLGKAADKMASKVSSALIRGKRKGLVAVGRGKQKLEEYDHKLEEKYNQIGQAVKEKSQPFVNKVKEGMSTAALAADILTKPAQTMFDKQQFRMDARSAEVQAEKDAVAANMEKMKNKPKEPNWLTKILGAISGVGSMITGFIGRFFGGKFLQGLKGLLFGKLGGKVMSAGWWAAKQAGKLGLRAMTSVGGMALRGAAMAAGTIVSSPVLLTATLVAGAAIGAYYLYKYMTRNKASNLEKLRLLQYGFGAAQEKLYYKIYGLEDILKDKIVYDPNRGVMSSKSDKETTIKIQELFDLKADDPKDAERISILKRWLQQRFLPVYLNHLNALNKIKPKFPTEDVNKLDPEQQQQYIQSLNVPTSIYNITKLPTKEAPDSTVTRDDIEKMLKIINDELALKIKNKPNVEDQNKPKTQVKEDKKQDPQKAQEEAKKYDDKEARMNAQKAQDNKDLTKAIEQPDTTPSAGKDSVNNTDKPNIATGPLVASNNSMVGIKLGKKVNYEGLHPKVKELFGGMAMEYYNLTGKSIPVGDAFRTYEQQYAAWKRDPSKAAKPGTSTHEHGVALDIDSLGGTADELEKLGLMKKYGFTRPIGQEKWHIEPAGVAINPAYAKQSPSKAQEVIEASIGKGGGGYGTLSNSIKKARDLNLQKALFKTDGNPVDVSSLMKQPVKTEVNPTKVDNPQTTATQNQTSTNEAPVNEPPRPQNTQTTPQINTQPVVKLEEPKVTQVQTSPLVDLSKMSTNDVDTAIRTASQITDVDYGLLNRIAEIESSKNARAANKNSTAKGLFQFIDSTWKDMIKKYGQKYNIPPDAKQENPLYSAIMGALYVKENLSYIKAKAGNTSIDDSTLAYIAHHYGREGAIKIALANQNTPNTPITAVVGAKAAAANAAEYRSPNGVKTVSQYVAYLRNKISKGVSSSAAVMDSSVNTADYKATPIPTAYTDNATQTSTSNNQAVNINKEKAPAPSYTPSTSAAPTQTTSTATNTPYQLDTSSMEKILNNQYDVLVKIYNTITTFSQNYKGPQPQAPAAIPSPKTKESKYAIDLSIAP